MCIRDRANTVEATLQHLRDDCIIPVFAKDNEATLSHVSFIATVQDAEHTFFNGERIGQTDIRAVSYTHLQTLLD